MILLRLNRTLYDDALDLDELLINHSTFCLKKIADMMRTWKKRNPVGVSSDGVFSAHDR